MENAIQISSKQELIRKVKAINLDTLTDAEILKIAKAVTADRLKDEFKFKIKESDFDLEKLLEEFYSLKKSENTIKAYKKSIGKFLNWIMERNIHPLNVIARTVDQYLIDLNKLEISAGTKHLLIAGIRNFYTYLLRYGIVKINPFKSIPALPKKERKRPLLVPNNSEIDKLKNYIKQVMKLKGRGASIARPAAKVMLTILDLLIQTGLRVGAVKTISFHHNSTIKYKSKGKDGQTELPPKLYDALRKFNLSEWNESRIQRNLESYCIKARIQVFFPHALRHYFAVNKYEENKDIYRIKELLGHSSIAITERYLKSLSVL